MANPTNLGDGDVVNEAWVDAVRAQVNLIYASTGARDADLTAPFPGQRAYIASNNSSEGPVDRNSAGQWRLPWNLPWGLVTEVLVTTPDTNKTTLADISGLTTGSLTAVANRKWLVEIELRGTQNSATGGAEVYLTDGSNNVVVRRAITLTASAIGAWRLSKTVTTSAGSVTYKGRANVGTGSFTIDCNAEYPAIIRVIDLGPAGAPA